MPRSISSLPRRVRSLAAVLVLPALCFTLIQLPRAGGVEVAPAPRLAKIMSPVEVDRVLVREVQDNTELMKNLQYLSDEIGPRLTGSKNLVRANEWAEQKMKDYGLEAVHLESWSIPVGWERGTASMKVVEPDTGVRCTVASWAWVPGTNGKITAPVVVLRGRTVADLQKYKGKLKGAVVLVTSPGTMPPVTDASYGGLGSPAPKKDEKKEEPKKEEVKKPEVPEGCEEQPPPPVDPPFGDGRFRLPPEVDAFLRAEGAACRVINARKPHGLLTMSGQWRGEDRGPQQDVLTQVVVSYESYSMLFRLANRPAPAVTKVELEVSNKFIPGPIDCFNTVGEVRGSERPDEFVVVGAHLDSWDLGTGTTDNGTGSCVVLETARAVAALARRGYPPKRTIRFCLFTGEEQGLHGSRQYTIRHKDEMLRTSVALVHDTGTGKVTGFGLHGRATVQKVLEPELTTLKEIPGWVGLDLKPVNGSDHQAFHAFSIPGFACLQEIDEYKYTHHTQTDTFDHAKGPNLVQGSQVMAVTCVRIANMPDLLPATRVLPKPKEEPKKEEIKKE